MLIFNENLISPKFDLDLIKWGWSINQFKKIPTDYQYSVTISKIDYLCPTLPSKSHEYHYVVPLWLGFNQYQSDLSL